MNLLVNMKRELNFAKAVAEEAGLIMLKYFQSGVTSKLKPDNTPVTKVDEAINLMVITIIKKQYPNHAILGEEESYIPKGASYKWICDPIDGTIPYTLGIPTNVFSLALVDESGQPIVAVVHDPYLKQKYWAVKNGGAFLNDFPIHVNKVNSLYKALIGNSGRTSQAVNAVEFKGEINVICYRSIVLNSVIYEAMLVASGKIAATILTGAGMHDAVSAKLIVEEAGGKVTDLFGNEQRYDVPIKGAIISNGVLHNKLVDIAKRYKILKP